MKKTLLALVLVLTLLAPALAEEPVKLTAVASLHTSTLDLETLPLYQRLAESANVEIEWEYYRADWDTKKNMILASGDLPDMFFGSYALKPNDIQLNQELFLPLEDLIAEHAPNISKMYTDIPATKALNTFPDGHIYALSHYMPARPTHYGSMYINTAWLEKLNLEMPTTIDELTEVARHFANDDPNGNGKKDELAFCFSDVNNTNFGARVFIGAFGIHDSIDSWLALGEDKATVIYNPAQPGYKQYVTWLRQIYEEGLMDPEVLTHDFAQYKAKSRRSEEEITGIQTGWEVSQMGNPNYGRLMPLTGPEGHKMVSGNSTLNKMGTNYACFALSADCADPIAAIKWVDQFYAPENGMESYFGTYDVCLQRNEDGTIERIAPEGQSIDNWQWTNGMSDNFVGYVDAETEAKLIYRDDWALKGLSKLDFDKAYAPFIDESYNYPVIILDFDAADEATTLYTDIEAITNTFTAQWIAEGGIEETWDEYLGELENAGLSRYLEIYQAAFDATK